MTHNTNIVLLSLFVFFLLISSLCLSACSLLFHAAHECGLAHNIIDNITYNLSLFEVTSIDNYKSSCSEIWSENPFHPSGNYILRSSTNVLKSVYCDMTSKFGSNSSGWMRIAKLDVQHCPQGLEEHNYNGNTIQACRVTKSDSGCTLLAFPMYHIQGRRKHNGCNGFGRCIIGQL